MPYTGLNYFGEPVERVKKLDSQTYEIETAPNGRRKRIHSAFAYHVKAEVWEAYVEAASKGKGNEFWEQFEQEVEEM